MKLDEVVIDREKKMSWPPWPPVMQPRGAANNIITPTMPGEGQISELGKVVEEVSPIRNFNHTLGKDSIVVNGGSTSRGSKGGNSNSVDTYA